MNYGLDVLLFYILFTIFGLLIGSFLNVCIYRLPQNEDIVYTRSHCQSCGSVIKWYDLIPVVSFILLRGRCRNCHTKLSVQYPIIELLNGLLYCMTIFVMGMNVRAILTCALTSCLIVITVIDWRTYEIPVGLNVFIGILGIIGLVIDYANWMNYLIGAVCVSGFLLLLFVFSKGRAIGGGDIKLMAAAGLLLGWQKIILAFALGCIIGSIIHVARMRISKQDHVLAFGPYLAVGIYIAQLFGTELINAYVSLL